MTFTREPWGKAEWIGTLLLLVLFLPVGLAALWRWAECKYVWMPDDLGERRPG